MKAGTKYAVLGLLLERPSAELLAPLQCATSRDAEALLEMLEGHEQACLDELSRMGELIGETAGGALPPTLVERLALEDRRLGLQARLMWIDYARRELREVALDPRGESCVS